MDQVDMTAFASAIRKKVGTRANGPVLGIGSIARECGVSPANLRLLLQEQFNPAFFAVCEKLLQVEARVFLIEEKES